MLCNILLNNYLPVNVKNECSEMLLSVSVGNYNCNLGIRKEYFTFIMIFLFKYLSKILTIIYKNIVREEKVQSIISSRRPQGVYHRVLASPTLCLGLQSLGLDLPPSSNSGKALFMTSKEGICNKYINEYLIKK